MTKFIDTSKEENQENVAARRNSGEFVRGTSTFRHIIGESKEFPAEPGRYHLFVALNCPWCHRVTLAREILGLDDAISLDVAYPNRTDENDPNGPNLWYFAPSKVSSLTSKVLPECTADTATGYDFRLVRDIYALEGSTEKSVPILYDKKSKRIVSNESAEIVRMLGAQAIELGSKFNKQQLPVLYPDINEHASLCKDIDKLNEYIYININNGAYKAGFSSDQSIYEQAFEDYFEALNTLEQRLAADRRSFLTGETFTEADLRLFPTLFRHDPIYFLRMKLNGARILDFPFLWRWLCRVYSLPGVKKSGSLLHARLGYFGRTGNKTVPSGPFLPMPYPEAYDHPELA